MNRQDQIDYNFKSAEDYGWSPEWFGATNFDDELTLKIEQFQYSLGLDSDGLVGPLTYRRIVAAREALEDNDDDTEEDERTTHNHLVYNGKHYPIRQQI